ncbi:hypothetical protein LCGC14_0621240 [marine sediment metagenome]|uniref:Uncharacterized protein n=1 Tax=marine sediment metagenome TaxID=412755 RepID=A0A0F9RP18_9ZZZZ
MLDVPHRQPTDNPIVGKATRIVIIVDGKQVKEWGGSFRCLYCDLEVSDQPDISVCPKCDAGSVKCAVCAQDLSGLDAGYHYGRNHPGYDASAKNPIPVTCSHCQTDSFVEPGLPADATLFCVQCGKPISRSEEE